MTLRFLAALLVIMLAPQVRGQGFSSGSTGADGPLALTTPGTVSFDPSMLNQRQSPARNDVYNFTSIYIGRGVVLKLSSKNLGSSIFWLSQGPVVIDGTIDLDGEDGQRIPAFAGAGGYPGGATGSPGDSPTGFVSNVFLVPLLGGNGGNGGETSGGGGGGGALLIASTTSIILNGAITANGGYSTDGTGGSGGAIRLVAAIVSGSGSLSAKAGQPQGSDGRIRFESNENQFAGSFNNTPFAQGKPLGLFLPPDPPPSVQIVSIGGVSVTGSQFRVNQSSPLLVSLQAQNVPPGTTIEIQSFPDNGPRQTVISTPVIGTFELSQATATVSFPSGVVHLYVKANWKQPMALEPQR